MCSTPGWTSGATSFSFRSMSKAVKAGEAAKTENLPFEEDLKRLESFYKTASRTSGRMVLREKFRAATEFGCRGQ